MGLAQAHLTFADYQVVEEREDAVGAVHPYVDDESWYEALAQPAPVAERSPGHCWFDVDRSLLAEGYHAQVAFLTRRSNSLPSRSASVVHFSPSSSKSSSRFAPNATSRSSSAASDDIRSTWMRFFPDFGTGTLTNIQRGDYDSSSPSPMLANSTWLTVHPPSENGCPERSYPRRVGAVDDDGMKCDSHECGSLGRWRMGQQNSILIDGSSPPTT